ncbi:MAG: response regulator transcription factor [Rubrivivax sp.]
MIRVLVVDDHPVVRAGYGRLLEQDGDIRVVAEAADAREGAAQWLRHEPDVTVADLSMPGGGGLELLRRVLARSSSARVLIFSMHDTQAVVQRAFETGACGYLTKASAPEGLVDAVRVLAAGRCYLAPELPAGWMVRGRGADDGHALAQLSGREFDVFRLLALGRSAGECAAELALSAKTVANHQSAIKAKLGVSTSAAMAHLALQLGVIAPAAGYP